MIQKLCNRTVFLHKGKVIYQGDTQKALDLYHTGFAGEALRAEIAAWARPGGGDGGFDWAVEFAEVFAPSANGGRAGGFDVVLANPPFSQNYSRATNSNFDLN